jgi:predicted regulator of Ras-like GTPase activity (Roadblock/LC7/MglB family)
MTAAAQCFIDLTPRGALLGAAGAAADARGRLLQALLLREPQRAWHRDELAQLLPGEPQAAARALFALQREGCIEVRLAAPGSGEPLSLDARLQAELQRLHEKCPGLRGAAVATDEGLPLCTLGSLAPETACATAAFLINELDAHLGLLQAGRAREVLIWTGDGPCYIARVASLPYAIALLAAGRMPAAALRRAGAQACARLAAVLAPLGARPIEKETAP